MEKSNITATNVSDGSVWGSAQHKSDMYRERKEPARRNLSGRLVAVTATGPIYRDRADFTVVPVSVGLAFMQELAARAINPEARVVSSLANRVGGDTARAVWVNTCGLSSAALVGASPRARLMFLNQVLAYVRRQKNVNGIEPILGAAVNAAWPWLTPTTLARVLTVTSKYLKKSEFAATHAIPILDPNNRTFTLFAPGALAKIDPDEWLDWRVIDRSGPGARGGAGSGGGGNGTNDREGLLGPRGPQRGDLPGADGSPGGDRGGNEFGGVVGDLLGPRGPKLGDLPGPDGNPLGGDRRDDALNRSAEELLGSRGPSLAGLEGPDGRPRGDNGGSEFGGLIGDLLGPRGPDLGNLGGNGGPYGAGAGLGAGGGWTPNDADKTWGNTVKSIGLATTIFGAGAVVTGFGLSLNPATAAGGPPLIYAGIAIGIVGAGALVVGFVVELKADSEKPGPVEPAPTGPTPAAKSEEPVSVPVITRPPAPKPENPKHTDLYPDPDGTGGGNPTRLPDFDGGGGNPTTLWDENGGGGNPTTLWDENGGGGNPTTTGKFVTATALTGRGLLAAVTQVGPATFAF